MKPKRTGNTILNWDKGDTAKINIDIRIQDKILSVGNHKAKLFIDKAIEANNEHVLYKDITTYK